MLTVKIIIIIISVMFHLFMMTIFANFSHFIKTRNKMKMKKMMLFNGQLADIVDHFVTFYELAYLNLSM